MTKPSKAKLRPLSREILGLTAICAVLSLLLMQILSAAGGALVDHYLYLYDITFTQAQYDDLNRLVSHFSLIVSVGFFTLLFLFLLADRLTYIKEILSGINALQQGRDDHIVPVEGNNELSQLAQAVNYLSRTQKEVRQKEQALAREKEQFIRTLSHDLRTPLTSVLSSSQLLMQQDLPDEQRQKCLQLIRDKALQIKTMTDLLIDDGKQNCEYFDNALLLIHQLAREFEEALENDFSVSLQIDCPPFAAAVDVQDLRRIFDNLITNVQKYADKSRAVELSVSFQNGTLTVCQQNKIRSHRPQTEGHRLGIASIRRISSAYGGSVQVRESGDDFALCVTLLLN